MLSPGWLCQPNVAPGSATIRWVMTSTSPLVCSRTFASLANLLWNSSSPRGARAVFGAYAARRRAVSRADEQPTPITATTAGTLIMTLLLL
jgi:hypothetical protein